MRNFASMLREGNSGQPVGEKQLFEHTFGSLCRCGKHLPPPSHLPHPLLPLPHLSPPLTCSSSTTHLQPPRICSKDHSSHLVEAHSIFLTYREPLDPHSFPLTYGGPSISRAKLGFGVNFGFVTIAHVRNTCLGCNVSLRLEMSLFCRQ